MLLCPIGTFGESGRIVRKRKVTMDYTRTSGRGYSTVEGTVQRKSARLKETVLVGRTHVFVELSVIVLSRRKTFRPTKIP